MLEAIQKNMAWKAVPVAGVVAGTAFLLINMIFNPILYGIDAFFILDYFASLLLGSDVLVESNATTLLVGIAVHYALSIVFALIISIVIHRWGLIVGIIGGAILGLAIYGINFYTMTVFFEWMFAINNTLIIVSHVVFGAVAGGVYEMLDSYDEELFSEEVSS